jgi:biotin-(acetyl-CoA carboxylase) ligase
LIERISGVDGSDAWLDDCRRYCMLTGRMVEVAGASQRQIGLCQGIAADGKLMLESAGRVSTVASGTVREVRRSR